MAEIDYYRVLRVDPEAEQEIVEVAYRRLAKMYHPDVYKEHDATERMQRINAAYQVLHDPARRRVYDSSRSRQTSPPPRSAPKDPEARGDKPRQQQPRPNANYTLRFGIYRGDTLQRVDQMHLGYLHSYLRTGTGDAAERNAIRRYLGIPHGSWESEDTQANPHPPPPKPPPRPFRPEEYILKYGEFAGRSLADVRHDQPNYLLSYLEHMFGSMNERNVIGQFLGVDPLEIHAEYLRRIQAEAKHAPLRQRYAHVGGMPPHKSWAGIITAVGLIALFVFAIVTSVRTVPATDIATPTGVNRPHGPAATVFGGAVAAFPSVAATPTNLPATPILTHVATVAQLPAVTKTSTPGLESTDASLRTVAPVTAAPIAASQSLTSYPGKIVYATANDQVYVVDADGKGQVKVGTGQSPVFSPDGKRVAYICDDNRGTSTSGAVCTVNLDGSNMGRQCVFAAFTATGLVRWSPGGRFIAVAASQNAVGTVQMCDMTTGKLLGRPQYLQGEVEQTFDWTPDGNAAIWESGWFAGKGGNLYYGNPDSFGEGATQLTNGQDRTAGSDGFYVLRAYLAGW